MSNGGVGEDKTQPSSGGYYYWIIKFCDSTLTTGLTPIVFEVQNISIAPNPTSDELTVINGLNHEGEIKIINTLGETLIVSEMQTSTATLNTSALPNGIYFLQFNSGAQHFNCKFVVQH